MLCMLFASVIPFHASSREVDGHMFNLFLTPNKANIFFFPLQRLKNEIADVTSEIENLGSTEER